MSLEFTEEVVATVVAHGLLETTIVEAAEILKGPNLPHIEFSFFFFSVFLPILFRPFNLRTM